MPVPDFQSVILPVLRLSASGEIKLGDAVERISDEFNLTYHERNEKVPSGVLTRIRDRVNWSVTYLNEAGLVVRPRRGYFKITEIGRSILLNPPKRIDSAFLMRFEGFRNFKSRKKKFNPAKVDSVDAKNVTDHITPSDKPRTSIDRRSQVIQSELQNRIMKISSVAFERLIVELMISMGYKQQEDRQKVEGIGSNRICHVFGIDALCLDLVYLEAKQCDSQSIISAKQIHEFAGALDGYGTSKGVFVTTSSYSLEAENFVRSISNQKRIRLISGRDLTELMVGYGVGIRRMRTHIVTRIDVDYFSFDSNSSADDLLS